MDGKHILLLVSSFNRIIGMIFSKANSTMRKHFLLLLLAVSLTAGAQTRGVKIGYIDMEYILQNVPDYAEANNQLEQKAQKWKQDIEAKKNEITKLKDALNTEKALLTKELIDEREEEIKFQETELTDYQQKRFGPNGDLMVQKAVLVKPIQDQVFTAAQDIAEAKKYDFIFDKSSDLTMLFAAKRFDISDQVVRAITRASKREQLSKKQLQEEQAKEARENMVDDNPAMSERQKQLDEKKAAREKLIADKKLAAEERKKAADEKRKQQLAEKEAKKKGTTVPKTDANSPDTQISPENKAADSTAVDPKKKAAEDRAKVLEERKKAAADRKAKILADREAAKKAKEAGQKSDTIEKKD
jgi:Skp family chaperone for outer membrane proteins